MVYLLLNDGIPVQKDEKLDKLFPHMEEVGAEYITKNASVKSNYRLIKTHLVSRHDLFLLFFAFNIFSAI